MQTDTCKLAFLIFHFFGFFFRFLLGRFFFHFHLSQFFSCVSFHFFVFSRFFIFGWSKVTRVTVGRDIHQPTKVFEFVIATLKAAI